LETNEDAHLLLEACFRGVLHRSRRGPRGYAPTVWSGCIFVWAQDTSAVGCWNDGLCWTPVGRDGDFWISRQKTMDEGLIKKTLSVVAQGCFHHIVSYYNSRSTVKETLKAPSQDMILRDSLHNSTTYSTSTKGCQFPHPIFKVNLVDDNAEDEMGNYSSTSLQPSEMPPVRLTEDEYNAYSHKCHRGGLRIMRREE
jgi:hypothetical protein